VTSFALGVEVAGGRSARLIPKNTPLPAQRTQMVTTASDDQSTVRIHVLQGEGATAAENTSLGQFELTGIAPGPKGSARIEVTFGVDTSGMVRVSAVDTRSGAREAIQIRAPGSLDAGERERMSAEAREIATRARDTQARREAETALRSRLPAVEACMRSESVASTEAELLAERAYAALAVKAPTETLRELIAWADRIRR
jgi:molecular chaperone DnaK